MMKKGLLRALAMLVVVLMAVSLYACGSTGNNQAASTAASTAAASVEASAPASSEAPAASTDPVTLKVYGYIFWGGPWSNTNGVQDDAVAQLVKKDTGITMDVEQAQNDFNDKLATMVASGDLPDVLKMNQQSKYLKTLIDNGLIAPLDDYLGTYGKNITKYAQNKVDFSKKFLSADTGKLYGFPTNMGNSVITGVDVPFFFGRWDLYKQLGYPAYKNFDEFLGVVKKMQDLEPKNAKGQKNYGMTAFMNDWDLFTFSELAGYMGLYPEINGAFMDVDLETYAAQSYITNDNGSFWTTMRWFNKAFQMGILDPESVTNKFSDCQAKGDANRILTAPWDWYLGGGRSAFQQAGTPEKDYIAMPMPSDIQRIRLNSVLPYGDSDGLVVVSSKCKNPERALQLIDWFHNPDNCMSVGYGPKGLGDTWDNVNGQPALTDAYYSETASDNAAFTQKVAANKYGGFKGLDSSYINPDTGLNLFLQGTRDGLKKQMDPKMRPDWLDFTQHYGVEVPADSYKGKIIGWNAAVTALLAPAPDDVKLIDANITDYLKKTAPKLAICKDQASFDALAKEIKDKCAELGLAKSDEFWSKAIADAAAKAQSIK